MNDLGTLGGDSSLGNDINDAGQVTGGSLTKDGSTHAFVTVNGVMTDLEIKSNFSIGRGINNTGQIAGVYNTAEGYSRAFVTENDVMTELGTLGGLFSNAYAINDLGQVVGDSTLVDGSTHNFVTINGVMTDIGYLGYITDINNAGQIVGQFDPGPYSSGKSGAFFYEEGNVFDLCLITDCVLSGWSELEVATAINDNGDIVGYGKTFDGQRHGFIVVNAVPVPAAVWLFGSGLLGLIGMARSKKS
jgi:probable HAF family extracellular repeat protein